MSNTDKAIIENQDLQHISPDLRYLATQIDNVSPDDKNAMGHSVDNLQAIADSLNQFGQRKPIVANRRTGQCIAGSGAWLAAKTLLGWEWLAVVWTDDDSLTAEMFGIADNAVASDQWQTQRLQDIISRAKEAGQDVPGVSDDWLADVLARAGVNGNENAGRDTKPQVDRAAELQEKWGTQLGQVWELGEHRLVCGDCTDKAVVEAVMQGEKADVIFTDPPYGMRLDADFSDMEGIGKGNKYKNIEGDFEDYDPTHIFDDFGYAKEIFLWGADYYAEKIPNRTDGSWIVWDKTEGGIRTNTAYDKMFGSNFELCWSKSKHKRAIARVLWKGIFGLGKEPGRKRYHPTQKPVRLGEWFLEKFTIDGQIVVDLFCGVGFVILAAHNLGRRCRAIEISPAYVGVTLQRYFEHTGIEPKLISE